MRTKDSIERVIEDEAKKEIKISVTEFCWAVSKIISAVLKFDKKVVITRRYRPIVTIQKFRSEK